MSYRHSVPTEVLSPLAGSAVALTAAALVMLAVGIDAVLFPSRGRGVSAALVVLAAAAAVVVPLAMRPVPVAPAAPVPFATETVTPARRVILVGIDGLSLEQIRQGVARGGLPALGQMMRRGAHGALATLRPTEAPPIWTSIFTGRLPRDHGVKSFATYRLRGSATVYELLPKGALVGLLERAGLVSTRPITSASRRSRALWNALNAFGIPAGIVRGWGTYPPERIQGFMLSPYFHLFQDDPARAADALHPRDLAPEVRARAFDGADVDRALLAPFIDFTAEVPQDELPWRRELVDRALAPDLTYQRGGAVLRAAYDPPFFATYYRRTRRGRPHVPALRAPGGLRRRTSRGAPPLRPRDGRVRRVPRPGGGRAGPGPEDGRGADRRLRLRHGAAAAVAAGLGVGLRRSAGPAARTTTLRTA